MKAIIFDSSGVKTHEAVFIDNCKINQVDPYKNPKNNDVKFSFIPTFITTWNKQPS